MPWSGGGGYMQHDEAAPLYTEMIDQTTRGHQFLLKNFGEAAIPRSTWQVTPALLLPRRAHTRTHDDCVLGIS